MNNNWLTEIKKTELNHIFNLLVNYCIKYNIVDNNNNYLFRNEMIQDFYLFAYNLSHK